MPDQAPFSGLQITPPILITTMDDKIDNNDPTVCQSFLNTPAYEGLALNDNIEITTDGLLLIGEDFGSVRPSIDRYVSDICSSTAPAWEWRTLSTGRQVLMPLHLGRFSGLLPTFLDRLQQDHTRPDFEPSLCSTLLHDAMEEMNFGETYTGGAHKQSMVPGRCNAELENDLLTRVRQKAIGRGFNQSAYELKRNSEKNYQRGKKFLDGVFDTHSRVIALRIDLSYQKQYRDELTLAQAQRDFRHLWNNARKNALFASQVGYMWSLEYTDLERFHFHLIILLNGAEVRSDYHYADQIGKYWVNTVTGGRGAFHNCNDPRNEYPIRAIGRIDSADLAKREALLKLGVGYLTKNAQLLPFDLKKVRTYGTSAIPRRTSAAGRPRTK